MTEQFIRLRQLLQIVPVSPMTVWRWERAGRFPRRRRLGANTVAWKLNEVLDWCAERDRNAEGAPTAADLCEPADGSRP